MLERHKRRMHQNSIVYFNLDDEVRASTLNSVTLSVYIRQISTAQEDPQRLSTISIRMVRYNETNDIYYLTPRSAALQRKFQLTVANTGQWYTFNDSALQSVVESWRRNPNINWGFHIHCHGYESGNLAFTNPEEDRSLVSLKSDVIRIFLRLCTETLLINKKRFYHGSLI